MADPVFLAASYNNVNFECLEIPVGTGPPTYTTPAGLLLPDHEGLYHAIGAALAPWHGSRVVTNLALHSGDFTNAAWVPSAATKEGVQSIAGPYGGMVNAMEVAFTASTGARIVQTVGGYANGDDKQGSIWVRMVSGTGEVRARVDNANFSNLPIDENWKRISGISLGTASADNVFGVNNSNDAQARNIYVWGGMSEKPTGQTNQNPSEYVPTVATAVTKHFANLNGNTVASNVVTEAAGALLDPLPSLYSAPALTNLTAQSNAFTTVPWALFGTPTLTQDQPGIDGAPNGGARVVNTGSASEGILNNNAFLGGVPGSVRVHRWMVNKNSTSVQARFFLYMSTQAQGMSVDLDCTTGIGTLIANANDAVFDVVDAGLYWDLYLQITDIWANGNSRCLMYADQSNAGGYVNVSYFGSYDSKTIAEVRGSAPIFTTGATASTVAIPTYYPTANWPVATQGAVYLEVTPRGDTGSGTYQYVLGSALTVAGSDILSYRSSNQQMQYRYNASNVLGQSTSIIYDQINKIAAAYGGVDVIPVSNGVDGTPKTNFDTTKNNDAFGIFARNNSPATFDSVHLVRNIRRYDLAYDDAKTQIDELMAGSDTGFPFPATGSLGTRPDAKNTTLGGGNTDDKEIVFLQANGATSDNINDAWVEFLAARGFTTGNLNTDFFAFLGGLGYTGTLADRKFTWWAAGAPLT